MAGRPPQLERLYGSTEALDARVDEFFELRTKEEKPPTIAGLSLFLGVDYETVRDGLDEEGANAAFRGSLKKARTRLADCFEQMLLSGKPVGSIFWLKGTGHIKEQTTVNVALDADSWAATLSAAREAKQLKRASKHAPQALPEST
jgi:hypothetical protein